MQFITARDNFIIQTNEIPKYVHIIIYCSRADHQTLESAN